MAPRFTLKCLLAGVAFTALALAALLNANQWWSWAAGTLAFALVGWALLLGLLRGRRAPFAVGFGVIGLLSLITFSPPTGYTGEDFDLGVGRSPTTALLEFVCPFQTHVVAEDPDSDSAAGRTDEETSAADEALFSPDAKAEADPDDEAFVTKEFEATDSFPTKLSLVISQGSQDVPESPDRFRIEPFVEIAQACSSSCLPRWAGLPPKRLPGAMRGGKPQTRRAASVRPKPGPEQHSLVFKAPRVGARHQCAQELIRRRIAVGVYVVQDQLRAHENDAARRDEEIPCAVSFGRESAELAAEDAHADRGLPRVAEQLLQAIEDGSVDEAGRILVIVREPTDCS